MLVSLTKGEDRYNNVYESLKLIKKDLAKLNRAKTVLIKPNLTATSKEDANTSIDALKAIIDFINENFSGAGEKELVIMEGSGSAYYDKTTTRSVFERYGYYDLEREYANLKVLSIDDETEFYPISIRSIAGNETINISKKAKGFDFKISLNLPKTHNYAIATFGIKNMMGLIKQEDKSLVHGLRTPSAPDANNIIGKIPTSWISWCRRRFPWLVNSILKKSIAYLKCMHVIHHNITLMGKELWPDLVVLDCYYAMEGDGPIDGELVKLGAAVASADPLKADGLAARLIGFNPEEIGYLYYMQSEGLGDYSLSGLVGEEFSGAICRVRPHATYNVQKNWKEVF